MRYLIVFFFGLFLLVPNSVMAASEVNVVLEKPFTLNDVPFESGTTTTDLTTFGKYYMFIDANKPGIHGAWIELDDTYDIVKVRSGSQRGGGIRMTFYNEAKEKVGQITPDVGCCTVGSNLFGVKYVSLLNVYGGLPNYTGSVEIWASQKPPESVSINSFTALHDKATLYFSGSFVEEYEVYRDGILIDKVSKSPYVLTGLSPLTTYKVHIVGKNKFGSLQSSVVNLKTTDVPPSPSFLSFKVTDVLDKSVRLSFSFLNADRYEVYRDGSMIAELPANSNGYIVKTDPSTTYQFWVVGINDFGRSASNVVDVTTQELLIPPFDPTLSVAGVYMDRVDLKVSVKRAKTIKFYRDNRLVNTIAGDVKTYTDNTVDANREYVYKFVADNEVGSVSSNDLKVKTLKPPVTDVPIIYISPSSKTFLDSMTFLLSSNDPDASLFYSFNGSDWFPYSSPVKISKTSDVYAKAVNVLGVESSVVVNRYVHRENPKVQLGVDLQDVVDAGGSHFNFLWPAVAFAVSILLAFLYAKYFRDLF